MMDSEAHDESTSPNILKTRCEQCFRDLDPERLPTECASHLCYVPSQDKVVLVLYLLI